MLTSRACEIRNNNPTKIIPSSSPDDDILTGKLSINKVKVELLFFFKNSYDWCNLTIIYGFTRPWLSCDC